MVLSIKLYPRDVTTLLHSTNLYTVEQTPCKGQHLIAEPKFPLWRGVLLPESCYIVKMDDSTSPDCIVLRESNVLTYILATNWQFDVNGEEFVDWNSW
ncbi:hypothetical protein LAZ67_11001430 [Cordylochernes scorpioides]|uniref:Uncharacterized protein n=1 Tax=Cordylochernes scorpioides TaxID=51811 RepID=A0ABY6L1V6_9ARAC|nr:hypothetical protein LAZ67_11001430 [Cordylochernes scorpioides]